MIKQIQIWFVFVLVMISIKFFDAQFLNASLVNYVLYFTIIGVVVLSFPFMVPKSGTGFIFPVQLMLISFLVSIFMANAYWDQSLKDSLIATAPYFILIFFFYLIRVNFPVKILEKIIVIYGVLYIVFYFFQFVNAPNILFGKSLWGDEFTESRGIVRIIFPGGGIFILSSFIAITKLTTQKKNLWFWFVITLFGILIPIMQVTRQFIAGILLIYGYHAIKTLSLSKKIVILIFLAIVMFYVQSLSLPMVKGLFEASQNDMSQGGDYIRILAGEYFLTDFSPSAITSIFGNGVPYTGVSNYGLFLDMLNANQEFFLSDVGLIAFYVMFGILATIAYVLIWIKSFILPLPKEFYYLKYYLWFLLLTSLTWYTTYHYHYFLMTVFVLYMYQSIYEKKRKKQDNELDSIGRITI